MRWAISVTIIIFITAIITIKLFLFSKLYIQIKNDSSKFSKDIEILDVAKARFDGYLRDFNKNYNEEEYKRRFKNFKASLKEIARLNKIENNTVFGLTKFSDMSKEEFADRMLQKPSNIQECIPRQRYCLDKPSDNENQPLSSTKYGGKIPRSHDWRKQGVVKPVLDQKLCQGCWAFAIVGVLESMSAIQLKDYTARSIEELIDCSSVNNGCNKGNVVLALNFICDNKLQFVTEKEYPLTLSMDQTCKLPTTGYRGRRVKMFNHMCNLKDEHRMVELLATHGPLIVAVNAKNWMYYTGGVIKRACSGGVLDHVVQIVGYEGYGEPDAETPIPYYIVRNSWGKNWGEEGYVKIAINRNVCGIAEQVTAIDALNNTSEV